VPRRDLPVTLKFASGKKDRKPTVKAVLR
jgi:hypothetical protein